MRADVRVLAAVAVLAAGPSLACVFDLPDVVAGGAGGAAVSSSTGSAAGGGAGGGASVAPGTPLSLAVLDATVVPTSVDVAPDGAIVVGGTLSGPADFGVATLGAGGFVARFDPETGVATAAMGFTGAVTGVVLSESEDGGTQVAVDYQGSVTLDGQTYTGGFPGAGSVVAFRLDGATVSWVRPFAGAAAVDVSAISALPGGDVAFVGSFTGTLDLGGGVQVNGGQGARAVIARLGPDGVALWARTLGGNGVATPRSVAPSSVTGGVLMGGGVRSGFNSDACTFQNVGDPDPFFVRYDALGTCAASVSWGDPKSFLPALVATSTKTFVAGVTDRDLSLDTVGAVTTGSTVGYLASITSAGLPEWAVRVVGAAGSTQALVGLDASTAGPVVAGTASLATDFGAGAVAGGTADAFVAAYDAAGKNRWVVRATGGTSDATAVATRGGRVAVVGTTVGAVQLGAGLTTGDTDAAFVLVVAE